MYAHSLIFRAQLDWNRYKFSASQIKSALKILWYSIKTGVTVTIPETKKNLLPPTSAEPNELLMNNNNF